jgi:hypothetical protein
VQTGLSGPVGVLFPPAQFSAQFGVIEIDWVLGRPAWESICFEKGGASA